MRVIAPIGGLAPIGVMAPGCDQKHEKKTFNCIFAPPSGLSHPRCDNPDINLSSSAAAAAGRMNVPLKLRSVKIKHSRIIIALTQFTRSNTARQSFCMLSTQHTYGTYGRRYGTSVPTALPPTVAQQTTKARKMQQCIRYIRSRQERQRESSGSTLTGTTNRYCTRHYGRQYSAASLFVLLPHAATQLAFGPIPYPFLQLATTVLRVTSTDRVHKRKK